MHSYELLARGRVVSSQRAVPSRLMDRVRKKASLGKQCSTFMLRNSASYSKGGSCWSRAQTVGFSSRMMHHSADCGIKATVNFQVISSTLISMRRF